MGISLIENNTKSPLKDPELLLWEKQRSREDKSHGCSAVLWRVCQRDGTSQHTALGLSR